jgi:hypothetical protein
MRPADYERAIAWIVRENPRRMHNKPAMIRWPTVQLVATLFEKAPTIVVRDVVEFANTTEKGEWAK